MCTGSNWCRAFVILVTVTTILVACPGRTNTRVEQSMSAGSDKRGNTLPSTDAECRIFLSGVWSRSSTIDADYESAGDFSWGKSSFDKHSLVVDLGDPQPFIRSELGTFDVLSIRYDRDRMLVECECRFGEDIGQVAIKIDRLWAIHFLEQAPPLPSIVETPGVTYYKIAGPGKD